MLRIAQAVRIARFGFAALVASSLTLPLPAVAGPPTRARSANDIGRALLACWHPPPDGGQITLSLSLRRDGTMIGAPRVAYVQSPTADKPDDLVPTILAAVKSCTPVALQPALAAVVAGQVLRIRFVATRGAQNVFVSWTGF